MAIFTFGNQFHGTDPEASTQLAIDWSRHTATLQMSEHNATGLFCGALLDLSCDTGSYPTQVRFTV
jgi:hypothetical protein